MSGLTIGSGSVIAANSVVSKNVEPYTIVGCNPARLIKRRYQDDITARLLRIKWWEWEDSVIDAVIPILQQPLTLDTLAILEDQYVALRS